MNTIEQKLLALKFAPYFPDGAAVVPLDVARRALPASYLRLLGRFGGGDFDDPVVIRCHEAPPHAVQGRYLVEGFLDVGQRETSLAIARGYNARKVPID